MDLSIHLPPALRLPPRQTGRAPSIALSDGEPKSILPGDALVWLDRAQ